VGGSEEEGGVRAFTVYPWYAWAFLVLDKRVENRPYGPPLGPGDWVAIHAGVRRMTAAEDLRALLEDASTAGWDADIHAAGEIDFHRDGAWARYDDENAVRGAVVAVAKFGGASTGGAVPPWGRDERFKGGPIWRWRLPSVIPLPEPVRMRGQLGLWNLPAPVLAAVAAQVPAAVIPAADRASVITNATTRRGARCAGQIR
jgi:hypothetical protein